MPLDSAPEYRIKPTVPQDRLIRTKSRYPAMVAGFGAGKTEALILRALRIKFEYPETNIAYYLPTYDLVNSIAFPRFEEELSKRGLMFGEHFSTVKNQTPKIRIVGAGEIIFRTMDRPERIVGYEVGDSLVDELDTLKTEQARLVWQKILSRNRQKKRNGEPNTIAVGTTPEGFRFVYERWKQKPPSAEYELIKASTYSNAANLPADYIQDLLNDYPSALIAAYLDGEFVNLTSGAVYPEFDRVLNATNERIKPGEALHIGMDFNVGNMAAVTFVSRSYEPYALDEIMKVLDTPAMILAIRRKYPNHAIYVYPDASGANRKSNNASESDIALLTAAGFNVLNNPANPFVKDRVLAVNRMILSGGKRRMKVNIETCPSFAEALEKQAYDKNGEPDKTTGLDHANDAAGYFINYRFPVVNRKIVKAKVGGI